MAVEHIVGLKRKSFRAKAGWALIALISACLIWHEELIVTAFDLHTMGGGDPLVLKLPPGVPDRTEKPSYDGLHPSEIPRPPDDFPFPIRLGEVGPVKPLYAGDLQYPWICMGERSRLGQPLVDNHDGVGVAVYEEDEKGNKTSKVLGYSKDCLTPAQAWYFYNQKGSKKFFPLDQANNDIEQVYVNGKWVDFIVRVEVGTINRYFYSLSVLKGEDETIDEPNGDNWNGRLVYQFRGGVGIGYKQGKLRPKYMLSRRYDALSKGYAVAYSTANQTSNTYNIMLAEDTALRVKKQFSALYGKPEFTIGIGGSGGAIQQYLIGQNGTDLLDGGIPLYSFPDMLTQTIYALDCELLEHYFDLVSEDDRWQRWEDRRYVEGLNSVTRENGYNIYHKLALAFNGRWPFRPEGMNECGYGWRGPAQVANNPRYFHYFRHFPESIFEQVHWSIWEDQKHIFGVGKDGFARQTWDNVGVQYGLSALIHGRITVDTFLDINSQVGGWKKASKMEPVRYWLHSGFASSIFELSPWSHHNMNISPDNGETPAARTKGSLAAIAAAYRSGNIFVGKLDIPVIDVRHYNDVKIDMHHSFASFEARQRLLEGQGHARNQVIWMSHLPHEPRLMAIQAMDRWLTAAKKRPDLPIWDSKPQDIQDACFDEKGELIAKGATVWDGEWNQKATGKCLEVYPNFTSSRGVAGSPVNGSVFKCHLQSVDNAIERGVYGGVDISPYIDRLKVIFPEGVCDYSKGDLGKPDKIFSSL